MMSAAVPSSKQIVRSCAMPGPGRPGGSGRYVVDQPAVRLGKRRQQAGKGVGERWRGQRRVSATVTWPARTWTWRDDGSVAHLPEPLSASYRNRVRDLLSGYPNHGVKHRPKPHSRKP